MGYCLSEQKRVETYLHPSSMQKIKNVVIKATLASTMVRYDAYVSSGVCEDNVSDLWLIIVFVCKYSNQGLRSYM